jgi:pilus assembly protein CpaE
MSRVTVVSPSAAFAERLSLVLLGEKEVSVSSWWDELIAAQPEYAVEEISVTDPSLVVLGPELDRRTVLELAAALGHKMPEVSVIEIAEPEPSLFPQAMAAGIKDIVAEDAPFEVLRDRIKRALAVSRRLTSRVHETEGKEGSTVVVIAPKGGTGKTSVMTNLAIVLSQQFPKEVVLVDLDLQFGGVCETLVTEPLHTIADAARLTPDAGRAPIKGLLTSRGDLFILAAPRSPEEADELDAELVANVVQTLASEFKWVLVDTPGGIAEPTIAVLENATDTLLLLSEDVLSLRAMEITIGLLDRLDFTKSARTLILNRANSRAGLSALAIEEFLGTRVDVAIPSSRQVPAALNRGQPFTEAQPNSTVSRRIADLAVHLVAKREQRQSSLVGGISSSR